MQARPRGCAEIWGWTGAAGWLLSGAQAEFENLVPACAEGVAASSLLAALVTECLKVPNPAPAATRTF